MDPSKKLFRGGKNAVDFDSNPVRGEGPWILEGIMTWYFFSDFTHLQA